MTDISAQLAAPFPPSVVSWRVGKMTNDKKKAMALAYIDQRDVIDRLNAVCGAFGWKSRNVPMPNGTTCCELIIKDPATGEWIEKSGGAGATGDVEDEKQREMAEKGGYSDALKRAAVLWGIGRYLYDVASPWVEVNEFKQIKPEELPRLRALLSNSAPAQTAPPARQAQAAPTGPAVEPAQLSARSAKATGEFERIEKVLRSCSSVADLGAAWKAAQDAIRQLPEGWKIKLTEEKDRCKEVLLTRLEAAE